jgi:hypothetical protein
MTPPALPSPYGNSLWDCRYRTGSNAISPSPRMKYDGGRVVTVHCPLTIHETVMT